MLFRSELSVSTAGRIYDPAAAAAGGMSGMGGSGGSDGGPMLSMSSMMSGGAGGEGAASAKAAKRVALSIANSPLVKTAIAGEDANWGRIVAAVGKAGEKAERDKLAIWFGDFRVAHKGLRDGTYDEAKTSAYMKGEKIDIRVDVGAGGKGAFYVIQPSDTEGRILSQVTLDGRCFGTATAYNGKVYVQTTQKIYAFGRPGDNPGLKPAAPEAAWPSETYFDAFHKLSEYVNGEPVLLYHAPKANTDGDSVVFFRHSEVISAGNLMSTVSYPVIDVDKGGSIDGVIAGLNTMFDLCAVEFMSQGGTTIIPGHGWLSDAADLEYYRDMLMVLRDRIQAMVDKKMTLAQVKAAKPTMDYDVEYGREPGVTAKFVEAVYRSLTEIGRAHV